jgi:hypothetical protein
MSDNYTGPVIQVPFLGPRDKFVLTLHSNHDDPDAIKAIAARLEEDGYKPVLSGVRKLWKENGHVIEREPKLGPIGFPTHAAYVR